MKAKRTVGMWILMCVGCLATGATGLDYTWTDGAEDRAWASNDNWDVAFCADPGICYPDDTDDDAIFPTNENTWTCNLIELEIEDLKIQDDVDFGTLESNPVLSVESVWITGPAEVTIRDATIKTD